MAGNAKGEEEGQQRKREEAAAHRLIVLWLFGTTLVGVVVMVAYIQGVPGLSRGNPRLLPVVIMAGILGSFVSALNRIYTSADVFPVKGRYPSLLRKFSLYLVAYSSIPPMIGAISAAVLYVLFASQIVAGDFFPRFVCECKDCVSSFTMFKEHWTPATAPDMAKAIVWGFISGFSERLVPSMLNKVAQSGPAAGTQGAGK